MRAIPLTAQNIAIIAESLGVSEESIEEKLQKSKEAYQERQNLEYTLEFFGADEKWLEETKKRVKAIAQTLPEDISRRDAMVAMYGWIEKETKIRGDLSIPMMSDAKYAHAQCIAKVLNGHIDSYLQLISWD